MSVVALCPDGGTCHHGCIRTIREVAGAPKVTCWRVSTCGPRSGVFPGDVWPDDVRYAHGTMPAARPMASVESRIREGVAQWRAKVGSAATARAAAEKADEQLARERHAALAENTCFMADTDNSMSMYITVPAHELAEGDLIVKGFGTWWPGDVRSYLDKATAQHRITRVSRPASERGSVVVDIEGEEYGLVVTCKDGINRAAQVPVRVRRSVLNAEGGRVLTAEQVRTMGEPLVAQLRETLRVKAEGLVTRDVIEVRAKDLQVGDWILPKGKMEIRNGMLADHSIGAVVRSVDMEQGLGMAVTFTGAISGNEVTENIPNDAICKIARVRPTVSGR